MGPSELIEAARNVVGRFSTPGGRVEAGSVAAALVSGRGTVYTGLCIDTECSLGFCAEHAAVAEMLKARESVISMVVAVRDDGGIVPPCGRCRELMWQLDPQNRDTIVVLGPDRIMCLKDLLPER